MMNRFRALVSSLALVVAPALAGAQSLSYNSGQNVAPAYEGWEEDADGTKYFLFGYMNRNWEETPNVPIGIGNNFSPGNPDQGQPTHFLPRRNDFVFRVKVPVNFTAKDELVWTLTTNGITEKAFASLRLDYRTDDVVKASETGALGAGSSSPEIRSNKPPFARVDGSKALTARVGQVVTIVTTVTDDGIPKRRNFGGGGRGGERGGPPAAPTVGTPPAPQGATPAAGNPLQGRGSSPPTRITVGKNIGLHLSWVIYRSPEKATVTFDPIQIKTWQDTRAGANSPWAPAWTPPTLPADGKVTVRATFALAGDYVLRAVADDGALTGHEDVTVTVTR